MELEEWLKEASTDSTTELEGGGGFEALLEQRQMASTRSAHASWSECSSNVFSTAVPR